MIANTKQMKAKRAALRRARRDGAKAMRAACLAVCDEVIAEAERRALQPGRIWTGPSAVIELENRIHKIELEVEE